jgi:CTP synthase
MMVCIPFFGICLGMQLAVIEFARNVCGIEDAYSTEFRQCTNPVIALITEWKRDGKKEVRSEKENMGGTMRLGSYNCNIAKGSLLESIYGKNKISERHRHRYEFNSHYKTQIENKGLIFSGESPDSGLCEAVELKGHPWFVAVQFHPEFKSQLFKSHPLFSSFLGAVTSYNHSKR